MENKMKKEFNQLIDSLTKKEAPITAKYRRKVLKESGLSASKRKKLKAKKDKDAYKTEDVMDFGRPLAKNEYQITEFANEELKMEFGPEVPEQFRKRALDWAKRKGLRAKEASLGKSDQSFTWVVFTK